MTGRRHMKKLVYLDNASTTHQKPPGVYEAMDWFMRKVCTSPGRSSHRLAIEAGKVILQARENLARLFNVSDPNRITFCLNATYALNLALLGILKEGDSVVTTSMEHNSVMRPLRYLERTKNVKVTVVKTDKQGRLDVDRFMKAVTKDTRLAVVNHASNVIGTIAPIEELGPRLHKRGVPLLVDAAQTAGIIPIDVQKSRISVLVFTGHKALYGPPGVGGIYVAKGTYIFPQIRGGTGTRSESEEQPCVMPEMLESGTPNTVGIAGLLEGVKSILSEGVNKIRKREEKLLSRLFDGLQSVPGITIYGVPNPAKRVPTVSVNLSGKEPGRVGDILHKKYDIAVRTGLQCAPPAHRTIRTFPEGTVCV